MRAWLPHIGLVLLASFLAGVFSQATSESEVLVRACSCPGACSLLALALAL